MSDLEAQVIDAEVIPDDTPAVSTDLARRERRSEVLKPLDPTTLLDSFRDYQELLQRLLTADDWQGPPNAKGSFVKKRGWRKIATAFDLDVKAIPGMSHVERDEDGNPLRAEVWVRAVSPAGRTMDGDGYCSADEPRFKEAKGRQKLENDLRATATTRAKNRAISDLVGMGAVSAEEVDDHAPQQQAEHPYGPPASKDSGDAMMKALGYLIGRDRDDQLVHESARRMRERFGGYFPEAAVWAVTFTADHQDKWAGTAPVEKDGTTAAEIEATEAGAK